MNLTTFTWISASARSTRPRHLLLLGTRLVTLVSSLSCWCSLWLSLYRFRSFWRGPERREGVERVISDSSSAISPERSARREDAVLQQDWRIQCSIGVLLTVVADRNLAAARNQRAVEELHERDLAAEVGAVALREREIPVDLADDLRPHGAKVPAPRFTTFPIKRMTADNSWYRLYFSREKHSYISHISKHTI